MLSEDDKRKAFRETLRAKAEAARLDEWSADGGHIRGAGAHS